MKFDVEKIFGVQANGEITMLLILIGLLMLFKYLMDVFRRDPRLVKFAATLPGPPALPLIGNGYEFFINGKNNIPKLLLQYGKKYGPTYRLWLGNRLLVGLADVDDLQVVFNHPNTINKPELLKPYTAFFDDSIFAMKSEHWKQSRKIVQPTLSKHVIKMKMPIMASTVKKYVDIMQKHVDGPEFNLMDYLPYLATDLFTQSMLSLKLDWDQLQYYKFHRIMHLADEMIVPRIFMPVLRFQWVGDLLYGKDVTNAKNKLKKFSKEMITETIPKIENQSHEKKSGYSSEKSLLAAVCEVRQRAGMQTPFHSHINDVPTTVIVSSHTTSATDSAFLVAIAIHPEVQEKLYDEIYNVFGDDDRPATYEDVMKLQYLDQVLKETERRFITIPFLFRNVEADTNIGSMVVPRGTQLMLRVIDVHWNEKWYPNPLAFNPENFSPEAVAKRPKYTFLTFSAGVRDCIGKYYAEISMRTTLVELVRNFKFSTTMKMTDIDSAASLTTNVPGGYRVSIERRK